MTNLHTSVPHDDAQNNDDDEVIQPVHAEMGCDCIPIGPSNSTINNSTQQENVILFTVHQYGSSSYHLQRVEVHVSQEIWPPFVAISHVRINGLGNSKDNKLPSCQLLVLQSLVNKLQNNNIANDTFFWIDTLCLPAPREFRKQAYLLQPIIFSRAQHVLVVDPSISQWPCRSTEDALIKIRVSAWKGRLWTLLEGFLAQNLVFLFYKSRMVDLDEILKDLNKLSGDMMRYLRPEFDGFPVGAAAMSRVMKPFIRDIMIWASEARRTRTVPVEHRQVDQSVLYTQLRLSCLSSPRFRLFVERDEARDIPGVCQSLIKVYGKYINQEHIADDHDKDVAHAVANLAAMSMLAPGWQETDAAITQIEFIE